MKTLDYGFYRIDGDYLEYLSHFDSEVYYNASYRSGTKPFIGIIIGIENYYYFIPLSSAKEKHKKWKNVSDEHFLIYEIIGNDINIEGDIYKYYSENKKMHILALLDIKKMIPVPKGHFEKIIFDELDDKRYRDLFRKEYHFCLDIREKILKKVETLYFKQKNSGIVRKAHCNYALLEQAMENWDLS